MSVLIRTKFSALAHDFSLRCLLCNGSPVRFLDWHITGEGKVQFWRFILHALPRCRLFWRSACTCLLLYCIILAPSFYTPSFARPPASPHSLATNVRWGNLAGTIFYTLSTDRGLPHPIATALHESTDGFLWVGTQGGLSRWDGYRFRTYLPDAKNLHSLPDVWVTAMHTDTAGRMWVATAEGGVARYDALLDQFERIPIGPGGLSHASVLALIDDGDGGIFIATEGGLDQYTPDTGGMRHWQHNPQEADSLPDNKVYALLREKNGTLWIGTGKGLVRRVPGSNRFERIALPIGNQQDAMVRTLSLMSDGSIWLGTRRHGAFVRAAPNAGQKDPPFQALQPLLRGENTNLPSQEWIHSICEISPNQIWLGSDSGGVIHIDQRSMRIRRIEHDVRMPRSLPNNAVSAIMRDRAGMVWTGTRGGLSRHDPHPHAFLTVFGGTSQKNGISDPSVWSILPLEDGQIWLGLGSNGVDVIAPESGLTLGLRPDMTRPETALPQEIVLSIAHGASQQILIGTSLGLYSYNLQAKQLQRIVLPGTGGLSEVRTLQRIGDKIWIGTASDGLWQMDVPDEAHSVQNSAQNPILARVSTDWLSEQRINVIEPGPNGALWLASRDSLILFDPATRRTEKIKPNVSELRALASSAITGMVTDYQGRLWLATFGTGINVLEKRDASGTPLFRRIGTAEGLPHANVNKLLLDKKGRIWASTDDGLAMIEPDTFTVHKYQRADGVNLSSYWARAGAITPQGELLFGGVGGITVVRPDFLEEWQYQPPVVLTDVRVGGKVLQANRFNHPNLAGQTPAPIVITPQANSLAVEFASLDYSAPEYNRYAYQLVGYENEWIATDANRRVVSYTNLPPGKYELRLRASNRSGEWAKQELHIPVRVLAAWHQTWWFRALQLFAALGAVYALLHVRTRYLRQHQLQLEKQVVTRTAEMFDTNLHLQHANAELEISAETLRQLGEVGRDITANLEANAVFEALHLHVERLLDTSVLVIYRTSSDGLALESGFGREGTQVLPVFRVQIDSPSSNAARAGREQQEILLERKVGQGVALPISGSRMLTSLYGPLVVGQRLLGVMSIQSRLEQAYGERERMIFRTLCSYGAIALANAEALSALHAAQAQLVQQEKLAALGGLVAGVAHEINTPIGNAMLALSGNHHAWQKLDQGMANASLSRSELQMTIGEGLEYTGLALQNIKRAVALITSFQGIAVSYASDAIDEVDLQRYLPDFVGLIHDDFEQYGHRVELLVEPNLTVEVVTAALTEVLSRIMANVLDHAFAAGRPGTVVLQARKNSNGAVEISIADNGQGIAASDLPRVFDPFYTSLPGSGGHVGLGLHVAYNHITHRLHGQVKIESTIGQGTVVTITLPQSANKNTTQAD